MYSFIFNDFIQGFVHSKNWYGNFKLVPQIFVCSNKFLILFTWNVYGQ